MMKNNFSKWLGCLFLMMAVTGLASCEIDDEDGIDGPDTYIGLWDLREEVVDDFVRTTVYNSDSETDFFLEVMDTGEFFIFRSASMYSSDYYDLVYDCCPENSGYWSISGRTIILRFDSGYEEYWEMCNVTRRHMDLEYEPFEGERMARHRTFDRVDYSRVNFLN